MSLDEFKSLEDVGEALCTTIRCLLRGDEVYKMTTTWLPNGKMVPLFEARIKVGDRQFSVRVQPMEAE